MILVVFAIVTTPTDIFPEIANVDACQRLAHAVAPTYDARSRGTKGDMQLVIVALIIANYAPPAKRPEM